MIMAGGSGTRFWPASRRDRPKQLLPLVSDQSMLQSTVQRLDSLVPAERTLILTNHRLVEATRQQLPGLPESSVIGEPCKRDTAPCIGLAAGLLARRDPEAVMLVMPADHVISRVDRFHQAVQTGLQIIAEDPRRLVTFGIQPGYPAQVFGYIQRGQALGPTAWQVARFREKPDLETARQFVESGEYYWNAGIFMWRCSTILAALKRREPEMAGHLSTIVEAADSARFAEVFASEFPAITGKSIDYAVMEHDDHVCVVPAPFDWDDVGNWSALPRLRGVDESGNTTHGNCLLIDTGNCVVHGEDERMLVTLGVNNLVVVQTDDATLVASLEDESAIRRVVKELEQRKLDRYL